MDSVVVDSLLISTPIVCFCNCFMFCYALVYANSCFAVILNGERERERERELIALLSLSSWCLMIVVWLFLAVPWVFLQVVIFLFIHLKATN